MQNSIYELQKVHSSAFWVRMRYLPAKQAFSAALFMCYKSGFNMNKKEMIDAVSQQTDLPKNKAESAINALLHTIQECLIRGDSVQLIGFGTFGISRRSARKGRNPQTGQEIQIPEATLPHFKAGSKLKEAVNNSKLA